MTLTPGQLLQKSLKESGIGNHLSSSSIALLHLCSRDIYPRIIQLAHHAFWVGQIYIPMGGPQDPQNRRQHSLQEGVQRMGRHQHTVHALRQLIMSRIWHVQDRPGWFLQNNPHPQPWRKTLRLRSKGGRIWKTLPERARTGWLMQSFNCCFLGNLVG